MANRRRYDDKFRASAVVMLEAAGYEKGANGGALTRVANNLGVPLTTLKGWFEASHNPPPTEVRNEKRGELTEAIQREIWRAFDHLDNTVLDANYRELITAIAILIDKLQLLEGKATDRTEIIDSTSPRESILNELAGLATRNGAGQDTQPVH